jgi:pyrroline-5-carboxylate reductase
MTAPDLGRGLGVLGGGHMGRALIESLLKRGADRSRLKVVETLVSTATALTRDLGIQVVPDGRSLFPEIETIILAIKPQDMARALHVLRPQLELHRPLVISIAAGLSVTQLQPWCGTDVPIVRAMPNRPALVGAGATGLYAAKSIPEPLRNRAATILGAAGIVVWVDDEALMDVVTAISGSGPAYFFRLAEALAAAGRSQGLSESAAMQLASATLHGAGAMTTSDASLPALRASVTSPGGTTAAALASFERNGLEAMVEAAVAAAVQRGRELSANADKGG